MGFLGVTLYMCDGFLPLDFFLSRPDEILEEIDIFLETLSVLPRVRIYFLES